MDLANSKTLENLKSAFASECQASNRFQAFAEQAAREGYRAIADAFRITAETESGHARGHLEFIWPPADADAAPASTPENLRAAIAAETHEYAEIYPGMARIARKEGFEEIADWFEALAKAESTHATRLQDALDTLG
jgi:rubrerythrin